MIFHGCKASKLCNAASSRTAAYLSERAKEQDDFGACHRLVMRSEPIVLSVLSFLHPARYGVVYYESNNPCVHHRGVHAPNSSPSLGGLFTPEPKALFSNVNHLGLFEIARRHGFEAADSCLAFKRSRTVNWDK